MSTSHRKQREKQQREARILDLARHMLDEGGYRGLKMDTIADKLGYAKGTIYNHFGCKEEIILALAIATMEKRTELFQRAAAFHGRPRERLAAIGVAAEVFVQMYPEHFKVEQVIRLSSIWEKTSARRQQIMRSCEHRCVGIVAGIVRDGIAHDDLQLPDTITPEDLVFALWSLTFGAYSIIATSESLQDLGISDPFLAVRNNIQHALDGYQWQPLSGELDYEALHDRIQLEVFPDEFAEFQVAIPG